MFENKIIIYGTGGDAKETLKNVRISQHVACVVGKDNYDTNEFKGFPLKNDECLKEIDYPFDLLIASQYFDIIHDRLQAEGKLNNINLKNIYIPNLMGRKAPYDGQGSQELSTSEWNWLDTNITGNESKELLKHLYLERTNPVYPSNSYLTYDTGSYHAGREDYWHTVKGTRMYETAIVVDAGAYIGDTINMLVNDIGGDVSKYYALEPMKENYDILKSGNYEGIDEFIPLCNALGHQKSTLIFQNSSEHKDAFSINADSSYISDDDTNKQVVEIITLDSMNLVADADYFVKMDIEGSELAALRGAHFIMRKRPNLAICLYHKTRDLIEIPQFVKSLVPNYEIHLVGGSHTIMIAK